MLDIHDILNRPVVLRGLTGLTPKEFRPLAKTFGQVWQEHTQTNWQGQERQRAAGAGPKPALESAEQKLFFILFYLRHYPIQAVLGYLFGFDQPQANKWIMRLLPLLRQALAREQMLPQRQLDALAKTLAKCEEKIFHLDATERPIRRPKNPQQQAACYSGRKKRHTVKNLVVSQQRTIQYLSPTTPGSQADKTLAEPLETVRFPRRSYMLMDLGFQGLALPKVKVLQPTKKPKGRELDVGLKQVNRMIAGVRVTVEHVIGGLKRCRIVSDIFRHIKAGYDDLVMETACGLHNWRELYRRGASRVLSPIQLN